MIGKFDDGFRPSSLLVDADRDSEKPAGRDLAGSIRDKLSWTTHTSCDELRNSARKYSIGFFFSADGTGEGRDSINNRFYYVFRLSFGGLNIFASMPLSKLSRGHIRTKIVQNVSSIVIFFKVLLRHELNCFFFII